MRLSIFARRDTINVQKLIGATDGFILRPFLYGGAMLGFSAVGVFTADPVGDSGNAPLVGGDRSGESLAPSLS